MSERFPLQPIEVASDGIVRFVGNPLVVYLLEAGRYDMLDLARLPGISAEARAQFAQLVGYSVSSALNLDYVCQIDGLREEIVAAEEKMRPRGEGR